MERGTGEKSAPREIAESHAMPTWALVTIEEVIADLKGRVIDGRTVLDDAMVARVRAYLTEHGARG